MAARLVEPFMTYFDDNGVPLASGSLTFELAGAPGTPKDTFSDEDLVTLNANPVSLDSAGRVITSIGDVFGSGQYRMIVKNSVGVQQGAVFDPLTPELTADLVNYQYPGGVVRTVQNRLVLRADVFDFGALVDGSTVDSVAAQNAINAISAAGGGEVAIPRGTMIAQNVDYKSNVTIVGAGRGATIIKADPTAAGTNDYILGVPHTVGSSDPDDNVKNIGLRDLTIEGTVATRAFSQFQHNLRLEGVSHVHISNCGIKGFRGDGIYLGAGGLGSVVRHNEHVFIVGCEFDGVNRDNRNGLTVIDGTNIHVLNNTYERCTRTGMPGAIDVEPNGVATEIIRDIYIIDNWFDDNGGDFAAIGVAVRPDIATTPITNIQIHGNSLRSQVGTLQQFIHVRNAVAAANVSYIGGVKITNNHSLAFGGIFVRGVDDYLVEGNTHIAAGGSPWVFGSQDTALVEVTDGTLRDNVVDGIGNNVAAIYFHDVSNLTLENNTVRNPESAGAVHNVFGLFGTGGTPTSSDNIRIRNNRSFGTQGKFVVVSNHTLDRETNEFSGNLWENGTEGDFDHPAKFNDVASFANSWVSGGAGSVAAYRREGETVMLSGLVDSGTVGLTAFTLPTGYRPAQDAIIAVSANGVFGELQISSDGTVVPLTGAAPFRLDGGIVAAVA